MDLMYDPDLHVPVIQAAYIRWSDSGYPGGSTYANGRADWVMIRWEYDRQLDALAALLGISP
jgi:hypothetical protein